LSVIKNPSVQQHSQ